MLIKSYRVDNHELTGVLIELRSNGVPFLVAQDDKNNQFVLLEQIEELDYIPHSISKKLSFEKSYDFDVETGETAVIHAPISIGNDVIVEVKSLQEVNNDRQEVEDEPKVVQETEATQGNTPDLESLYYEVEKALNERLQMLTELADAGRLDILADEDKTKYQLEIASHLPTLMAIPVKREELLRSIVLAAVDNGYTEDYTSSRAVSDVEEALSNNFGQYPQIIELKDKIDTALYEVIDSQMVYEEDLDEDVEATGSDNFEDQLAIFYNTHGLGGQDKKAKENQALNNEEEIEEGEEMARETYRNEDGIEMSVASSKKNKREEELVEEVEDEKLSEVEQLKRRLAELEGKKTEVSETNYKSRKKKSGKAKQIIAGLLFGVIALGGLGVGYVAVNNIVNSQPSKTAETTKETDKDIKDVGSDNTSKDSKISKASSSEKGTVGSTKTESEEDTYLLTKEEHQDYMRRLDNIGSGIYINDDGTLGGELKFSNGETKRIAEFTRDGDLIMEDGTRYDLGKVQGLLKRVENGG